MPWVYIVRCSDDSYYVGSTTNLDHRLWQHNESDDEGAKHTRKRRPVVLVWSAWFDRVDEAFAYERRIHGWSRRKKEALMAEDWQTLQAFAARPSMREKRLRSSSED